MASTYSVKCSVCGYILHRAKKKWGYVLRQCKPCALKAQVKLSAGVK